MSPLKKASKCTEFSGSLDESGYGLRKVDGRIWKVHRLNWVLHYGKIPVGTHVLHRCDNPKCFNIDHLFLGTNQDNAIDRETKKRGYNSRKTHCKRGHEFTIANTYFIKTPDPNHHNRMCKACRRIVSGQAK